MGPLTPFWIKWPLVKARLGHLYHYVNGEILDSVLFSTEIKIKWSHLKFPRLNTVCLWASYIMVSPTLCWLLGERSLPIELLVYKSEGDIVTVSIRPSVHPLCYLLLNQWTKFNQIRCVSYSHEWGEQHQFFLPRPLGPWGGGGGGSKGQISFIFNYKVNFKDFYSKLLVCSHKWKIQNISDGFFILSPGSCPRGGTWGYWGCPGGQKTFLATPPGALGRGQKVKYHLISITNSKLLVCSHKWKIQNISDGFFILSPGSCPRGGTWGYWGCPGGHFFWGATPPGALGRGQKVKYH